MILVALLACSGRADKSPVETDAPVDSPDTDTDSDVPACTESNDPSEWSVLADGLPVGVLLAAWTDGDEVLFVGGQMDGTGGGLARWGPDGLCTEENVTERALWWIHGPRPGEWYAVGEAGTVLHEVNGERTREDVGTSVTLYGVWAEDDEAWAVGGDPFTANTGEVWHRVGGTWTQVGFNLPGTIFKVWDGWFVGDQVAYRWDGGALTPDAMPDKLLTVRGRRAKVWAVGGVATPVVRSWDGDSWESFSTTGLTQPLSGIWTDSGEDLWVAGFFGTTARWKDGQWVLPSPAPSQEHFHAVWKHCDDVLFVGGNLFSLSGNYGTIVRYGPGHAPATIKTCRR